MFVCLFTFIYCRFACLFWGFTPYQRVFHLFNGESLQIYVSWTILTSTYIVHYPDTGRPVVVQFP